MIKKLIIIFVIAGILFYTGIAGKIFGNSTVKKIFSGTISVVTSMLKAGVDAGLKETGMNDPAKRKEAIRMMKKEGTKALKETGNAMKEGFKEGLQE